MVKISFVGAGSMAEAVISGMIDQELYSKDHIYVMNKKNKARLQELENVYGVVTSQDKEEVISKADIVVLATKPHDIEVALQDIAPYLDEDQLIISMLAGVSTEAIVQHVGKNIPVIRTMPNTSAMIGYSATAICKGKFANERHLAQTKELFEAIGTVSVVEEDQMHIVTGISGSGPAYVYYLVEAMEEAAMDEGLDQETAQQLIIQTIVGSGKMLKEREESAQQLRENVTSPNGTTAAGLASLKEKGFKEAVIACVKSATRRSEELGKE